MSVLNIATGSPKVGAVGVKIIVETTEDLSAATQSDLRFLKAGGTVLTVTGTVENTYNIYYVTTTDDDGDGNTLFTIAGQWRVTPDITVSGYSGYMDTLQFRVKGADE